MNIRTYFYAMFFAAVLVYCLSAEALRAQTDIFIRGSGRLFPLAVPQLCLESGTTSANKDIPTTIGRNLDLSGYFQVLDPGGYLETPGKCSPNQEFAYSDWSVIGAEGLVKGVVRYDGTTLRVQMYLHDVPRQKVVLGKEYEGDISQASRMAHKFSNEIMKFFTGEYGVFGTQIGFSSRVGRYKELFVMDMDGSNIRQLTNDKSLSVSSSWDPLGTKLIYTSYRRGVPDLFMVDVNRRAVTQVTRTPAMEIGSKFSKDGGSIITSVASGGETDIVLMSPSGAVLKRITPSNGAIDVSPEFSPDGSQIVFVSNRSGGPQVYVMGAGGGEARRISFMNSNYCTSPAWSPKGNRIALVCRADGGFQLFTVNADGSDPLQLTSGGDNEDPDWSPDGRYLVFATTFGKGYATSMALMRDDGSNMRALTKGRVADSEPDWGPLID